MLYTFSQANYLQTELRQIFSQITSQDAVVLWQDGVLLLFKQSLLIQDFEQRYFVLEQDLTARGLSIPAYLKQQVNAISLADFVQLTEQYFPQVAL